MNKKTLLDTLNRAKVALDKSCSTLGADCSVVRNNKLYNTNERLCIVQDFPSDSFSVNGDTLLNAVKSIKNDEVSITVSPKNITIRGGKTKINIAQSEEQISTRILSIQPEDPDWKKLPDNFNNILDLVVVSTVDKKLNGVLLNGEYAFSSDGWQINRVMLDSQFDPIWLSQKNITDIISFGSMDLYYMENSWLHLKKDTALFSCRKLDHTTYPLPLLEKTIARFDEAGVAIDDSEVIFDLWESIKAAITLTDSGKVTVQITDGELFIDAHCATGDYSNVIDVDISSMDMYTIFAKRSVDVLSKEGIKSLSFHNMNGKKAMVARGEVDGSEWLSLLSAE